MTASTADSKSTRGAAFSIQDTNALKGIAILGIAFHNFLHRVPNIVQENEFEFDPSRFPLFLQQLSDPATCVQAFFSFFGHYGVGVFVALSSYGLAVSCLNSRPLGALAFLGERWRKLFPMIGMCISIWLLLQLRTHAPSDAAYWSATLLEVALLCTGLFTIAPGFGPAAVGPWWFVSFILQFYLLWALAGARLMRTSTRSLILISAFALCVLYLLNDRLIRDVGITLLETPIGHFPEIALGILMTRFKPAAFRAWLPPLVILLVLGNASHFLWPLASVCAAALMLVAFDASRRDGSRLHALAWIGGLSLPIFMLNGFIRRPFLMLSNSLNLAGSDLVLSVVSVASSILAAVLLSRLLKAAGAARAARTVVRG